MKTNKALAAGSACLVCESTLTLEIRRGPDGVLRLLHCNHCGSEVPVMIPEDDRRIEEYRRKLEYVRALGEVYIYPSDWRCAKMGGPPEIDAYEKVDLSDV